VTKEVALVMKASLAFFASVQSEGPLDELELQRVAKRFQRLSGVMPDRMPLSV
jgi:hypothetical protein